MNIPKHIFSGYHGKGHCQGIAVDRKNGYIYYSFTTKLVKSDLNGHVIGSVDGLIGHLGCIDFNDEDGRLYGSLEYKNDSIGRGILRNLNLAEKQIRNAFYCVIFDVDRIDREHMDAEKDGVMRAVYLPEVVEDFSAEVTVDGTVYPHKYACSGIDGTSWGPDWGKADGKQYLNICYGVYGDIHRQDNDYQVILNFDAENWWDTIAQPLNQERMHTCGVRSRGKHFLFTGNTEWGVQNLEYDAYRNRWLAAVYTGRKPLYPNYKMYVIDGDAAPVTDRHSAYGEDISRLSLRQEGLEQDGIRGNRFPYGATGIHAFGNGYYYFSVDGNDPEKGQYTNVYLYRASDDAKIPFERVE